MIIMRCVLRIVLLAPLLIAGCAVNQKAEVARYRQILDQRVPTTQPYAPTEPLTLSRAIELASAADEGLATQGEDYVQALIAKNRALAAFLPTVSFQPSFAVEQPPAGSQAGFTGVGPVSTGIGSFGVGNIAGAAIATPPQNAGSGSFHRTGPVLTRFEAPVVGNINLFRGFGDVANVKVAEADIWWRKYQLLDLQDTIMLNVAQGFYQVLRSEHQVAVISASLAVQEERVRLIKDQFTHKLATKLAVAQSEAQADATRVTLVQAQGDVRNGRYTLAYLIGVPAIIGPLLDDLSPPGLWPAEPNFETDALKFRQDFLAAHANTIAARHTVDVYMSQYYPSVSLNISGFLYREYFADASKWDAILSANLPIFSAGLIQADVRAAWSRLRQAALFESGLRRQVLNDVQIAYQNLLTADRTVIELQGEVAAADEAYRQAQSAFANGLAINLDVLTAQSQLLDAQLQLTSTRYDRIVFYLDLIRAAGRITPFSLVATTHPATAATTNQP
jgi:outer membrane protein